MIDCHLMEASVHISLAVCLINCYGAGGVRLHTDESIAHASIWAYGHYTCQYTGIIHASIRALHMRVYNRMSIYRHYTYKIANARLPCMCGSGWLSVSVCVRWVLPVILWGAWRWVGNFAYAQVPKYCGTSFKSGWQLGMMQALHMNIWHHYQRVGISSYHDFGPLVLY